MFRCVITDNKFSLVFYQKTAFESSELDCGDQNLKSWINGRSATSWFMYIGIFMEYFDRYDQTLHGYDKLHGRTN